MTTISSQIPSKNGATLEFTIDAMSQSTGCFHSKHLHSFRGVSIVLPLNHCAGCNQRLQSLNVFGSISSNQVLQCAACGVYAHRSCAFSRSLEWAETCPVNSASLRQQREAQEHEQEQEQADVLVKEAEAEEEKGKGKEEERLEFDEKLKEARDEHDEQQSEQEQLEPMDVDGCDENGPCGEPDQAKNPPPDDQTDGNSNSDKDKDKDNESNSNTPTQSQRKSIFGTLLSSIGVTSLISPPAADLNSPPDSEPSTDVSHTDDSNDGTENHEETQGNVPQTLQNQERPIGSIFRASECPSVRSKPDETDTNAIEERPIIRVAASEDGILDGAMSKIRSKADFPFLSASRLFSAITDDAKIQGTKSTEYIPSDNGRSIIRSTTWNGTKNHSDDGTPVVEEVQEGSEQVDTTKSSTITTEKMKAARCNTTSGKTDGVDVEDDDDIDDSMAWTEHGPPPHWATYKSVQGIFSDKNQTDDTEEASREKQESLHFATHPFASISNALQENVTAHFKSKDRKESHATPIQQPESEIFQKPNEPPDEDPPAEAAAAKDPVETETVKSDDTSSGGTTREGDPPADEEIQKLLEEVRPKPDPSVVHKRLGLATVAGGIAGGVAGLVIAGPVGGVIGVKAGQTAGMLGVILEGSFTIGVLASGVAAGSMYSQQLQERFGENRVLALGEDGSERRVLLVRPGVKTDPVWDDLYRETRQSFPTGMSFNLLPSETRSANRERYEREVDIVNSDETEIPTADKVLLLVSRILNNKDSLPGFVYRKLLRLLRERSTERDSQGKKCQVQENPVTDDSKTDVTDEDGQDENDAGTDAIRGRRQDAHAVIKYVTAALLEVRPGFGVSPSVTELTATAVESLVFGEVYDLVIEEIERDYEEKDNDLLSKIAAFERRQAATEDGLRQYKDVISEDALRALHCLPEAHSAVDKLRYCVEFLDKIAQFFSSSSQNEKSKNRKRQRNRSQQPMGADSLLKMVCQHILLAKVFSINAQIAFLEEFARDEQLLRGREGYALVTLQASLHFLNVSGDFQKDIFDQED